MQALIKQKITAQYIHTIFLLLAVCPCFPRKVTGQHYKLQGKKLLWKPVTTQISGAYAAGWFR